MRYVSAAAWRSPPSKAARCSRACARAPRPVPRRAGFPPGALDQGVGLGAAGRRDGDAAGVAVPGRELQAEESAHAVCVVLRAAARPRASAGRRAASSTRSSCSRRSRTASASRSAGWSGGRRRIRTGVRWSVGPIHGQIKLGRQPVVAPGGQLRPGGRQTPSAPATDRSAWRRSRRALIRSSSAASPPRRGGPRWPRSRLRWRRRRGPAPVPVGSTGW